jgi:UDP-2-acetamido-2,6-beta-L-arabino-hexul-4-ose reductase
MQGNCGFLQTLLDKLKKYENTCPIMYASSTQAALDIPYGISKKAGEEALLDYAEETGANVFLYRFSNIFGKLCRPNYNSVVATFCYNITHDLPIEIHNPGTELQLIHIDDLTEEMLRVILGQENRKGIYCEVPVSYRVTLEKLVAFLKNFQESRTTLTLPDMSDEFVKKLYSTWLTYLPEQGLSYKPLMHKDQRGSFTEFLKQPALGQVSVNVARPGILKGNHWHSLKNEKFLVVSGQGIIRLRKVNEQEVYEYKVSQQQLEVIDIPSGYVHNMENTGETDMVTIIWANEGFDTERPDTYFAEV